MDRESQRKQGPTSWQQHFFSWRVQRSLQVNILVTFATLMVVTVMVIVGYTYQQNSEAILNLSHDLIAQVTETSIERTTNHLLPAAVMAQVSAQIPAVDTLSLVENEELEQYGMEILQLYPQLAGFFIGNEQGEFLFTKRFPDGGIGTQVIEYREETAVRTWTYRDLDGNVVDVEVSTDFTYDPRERPWYQGAKATSRQYWTDVYIFFTDQKPGITASYPVLDENGSLVSVIGIDIALDELSRFLETQQVGKDGVVFILNDKGEVIAYPGLGLATREGGAFRPANIRDLGIESVTAAYEQHQRSPQSLFDLTTANTRYIAAFTPFPGAFDQNWEIGIVVPEDDFVGTIKRTNRISLIISIVILSAAIMMAIILSRSISRPIELLTEETRQISDLRLDSNLQVNSAIHEVQVLAESISHMKQSLQVFKKYAPASLVRQLIQAGEKGSPGGQQKKLTLMFTDIGGLSGLGQQAMPGYLMQQLASYVGELTNVVIEEKGSLDTYMGDGLLAFWGAPLPSRHSYHACRAALRCQQQSKRMNDSWRAGGNITFPLHIGIHTGDTLVGNIGSELHMSYTVVGENVNLVRYLEALNYIYGSSILVSEDTYQEVAPHFHFRPLDCVIIKDRYDRRMIYELMGEKNRVADDVWELCDLFTAGFHAYTARDWPTAVSIFQSLAQKFPYDSATQIYLGRCLSLQATPPGPDWEPVSTLEFLNQPRIVT